jgi:hypothetical protein
MRWLYVPAFACLVHGTTACGGEGTPPPQAPKPSAPQVTEIERYLPLINDTVFAYDTRQENTGEKGALMMHVRRRRPDLVELEVAGHVQRLDLVPDGVRVASGGWLLKEPLREGARFKGDSGEVTVTSVGKSTDVPAGHFDDCVETTEVSVAGQKKVTTLYCRDVGIVRLDVEGEIGEDYVRESAVLRSHGPRIDVGADLPPPPPKK